VHRICPCRSSIATSKVLFTLAGFFAVCEPGASSNSIAPGLGRTVARTRSSIRLRSNGDRPRTSALAWSAR
jgi:hypothetical protein